MRTETRPEDGSTPAQNLSIRFVGVGNATAAMNGLGASACVLESDQSPLLLIDCGPDALTRYTELYGDELPPAVFITHAHYDHIGGLEGLFYRAILGPRPAEPLPLYVPVDLVATLHQRLAGSPMALAEGGANFWDAFRLVPVGEKFWHRGRMFDVFPVRHHGYRNAFGLGLAGAFVYTGDTKPIPELLVHFACRGEVVFHDCCIGDNPSHTGVAELASSYDLDQRRRLVLYHYESAAAGEHLRAAGYRIATPGARFAVGPDHRMPESVPGSAPWQHLMNLEAS